MSPAFYTSRHGTLMVCIPSESFPYQMEKTREQLAQARAHKYSPATHIKGSQLHTADPHFSSRRPQVRNDLKLPHDGPTACQTNKVSEHRDGWCSKDERKSLGRYPIHSTPYITKWLEWITWLHIFDRVEDISLEDATPELFLPNVQLRTLRVATHL